MKKIQIISKEMKKIQTKLFSIIAVVMLLLAISCQDLTEINTSPNQLSASDINVKYVLTSVLSTTATNYIRPHVYGGTVTLSEAMQYMQRDYIDWQGTNSFVWGPTALGSVYSPLKNSQYIYENAKNEVLEGNQKFYTAVGLIMRSFWYGFMTSLWGDIPYSEAMKAQAGNFTPVYDAQKDIFKGILADLKTANEILSTVTTVDGASAADIMYGGDITKWRKFANSLRLRYLIRLSEKLSDMTAAGVDVKGDFSAIVGNSSTYPIFTSSGDNASISFPGTDATNGWYGGPTGWSNRSEFYRRKPCATFVNELRANLDPRLTVFIRPVDTQLRVTSTATGYAKLPDGQVVRNIPPSTPGVAALDTARYVGLLPALQDPNLYNLYTGTDFNAIKALIPGVYFDLAANPNVSYLADKYAQDKNDVVKAVYLSYAELSFTLAEARLKGWITAGTAADYYQAGVVGSLRQYSIINGSVTVYNPQTHALVPFVESAFTADLASKFNSAASDAIRLKLIMTQKWLADFMTPEFWFDWRRTGLPNFGANLISASNGSKIPVRYIYGDDEKILNGPNVTKAITTLSPAEDKHWSKMWLLQGTTNPW
jgi:hypothetical protein